GDPDRLAVRGADGIDVVTVDLDQVPAERHEPPTVQIEVPAMHRLAGLAEAVDVDDGGQVVEPCVRRMFEALPHRPFGELAVTGQDPDPVGQTIEPFPGEGDADRDR